MRVRNIRRWAATLLLAGTLGTATAAEGLWFPWQITPEKLSASEGRLHPSAFFENGAPGRLCRVVCRTSTGGSGAVVSPRGLVLTNYHVIQGLLPCLEQERAFSPERGFAAFSPAEEIPLPGLELEFTTGIEDVSDRVRGQFRAGLTPDRLRQREKETLARLVRECRPRDGEECRIVAGEGPRTWFRLTVRRLSDVRLVYVPPRSIADLGGEADNWRMPRFAADVVLVRAWTAPGERPAPFGPANVPWSSRDYLRISRRGVGPGDFQVVIGYPGVTFRNQTSADASFAFRRIVPRRVELFGGMLEALETVAGRSPEESTRLSGRVRQVSNLALQARGLLESMTARDIPARMLAGERRKALREGVEGPASLQRRLDAQSRLLERLDGPLERDLLLSYLIWSCDGINAAETLNRYHRERDLPDESRSPDFRAGALRSLAGRLKNSCRGLSPEADKRLLSLFIRRLSRLPEACRLDSVQGALEETTPGAGEQAADALADRLVSGTRLLDPDERVRLMDPGYFRSRQGQDPLLRFHRSLLRDLGPLQARERPYRDELIRLRERVLDLGREDVPDPAFDANGTLRVSLGRVRALDTGRWAGTWRTTLAGAVVRDDGKSPEPLPGKLRELEQRRDFGPWADPLTGELPVNYTCDADLTAGNSGSPVLDADGHLAGLLFDGLYEGIGSDWLYDDTVSRAVCVDIRYVLFLLDRLTGADPLLRELLPDPDGLPEGQGTRAR